MFIMLETLYSYIDYFYNYLGLSKDTEKPFKKPDSYKNVNTSSIRS